MPRTLKLAALPTDTADSDKHARKSKSS